MDAANQNAVLIWSAGAIGGTQCAYMTRVGEPVLLVDAHMRTISRNGLSIEGPVEIFCQKPVQTVLSQMLSVCYQRIILVVKAQHTWCVLLY